MASSAAADARCAELSAARLMARVESCDRRWLLLVSYLERASLFLLPGLAASGNRLTRRTKKDIPSWVKRRPYRPGRRVSHVFVRTYTILLGSPLSGGRESTGKILIRWKLMAPPQPRLLDGPPHDREALGQQVQTEEPPEPVQTEKPRGLRRAARVGPVGAGIGGVRIPKGIPGPHEQRAGLSRKLPQGRDAGDSRVPQISEAVISRNRNESLRNLHGTGSPAHPNRRVRSKYLVFHSKALLTPSPRPNS